MDPAEGAQPAAADPAEPTGPPWRRGPHAGEVPWRRPPWWPEGEPFPPHGPPSWARRRYRGFVWRFAFFVLAIIALGGALGQVITFLLATALGKDLKGTISPLFYVVAIIFAFVRPWMSEALYVLVALMWLIPDRRIERTISEAPREDGTSS